MFFKQYNYKPRSNSQSGQGEASGAAAAAAGSPPKEATASPAGNAAGGTGAVSAGIAGRRRSSAAGADKFAGLHGYKRNSQDAAAGERKASWADQKPGGGGVLSGMWNNFTKGEGK